jgi:hypothetical protein
MVLHEAKGAARASMKGAHSLTRPAQRVGWDYLCSDCGDLQVLHR